MISILLPNMAEPRVSLECNPEIPVAPGVEYYVLDTSLDANVSVNIGSFCVPSITLVV